MPATATTRRAQVWVVEVCLPGESSLPAGVVLADEESGDYRIRFRRDWDSIAPEESEVLSVLAEDFESKLREQGVASWMRQCEDQFSNTIRITDRESIIVENLDKGVERLYNKTVSPKVLPFVTHLPKFSARVAAGKFLEDNEVDAEEWIEAPDNLRLDEGMFIVEITGHSMEPRIPDGSLCVFRHNVSGSRQGKLLLVERKDISESGGRYTVKRYRSVKRETAEGWSHALIRLEPLNPEFEAWELEEDPDLFRIIGEFVQVIS